MIHCIKTTLLLVAALVCVIDADGAKCTVDVRFVRDARSETATCIRAEVSTTNELAELNGVVYKAGVFKVGEHGGWQILASWPPKFHRRDEFVPGKRYDGDWGDDPAAVMVVFGDGTWKLWLADISKEYSDLVFSHVTEREGAVEVTLSFQASGYVKRGLSQLVGDIWELCGKGGREEAIAAIRGWYELIGQRPPIGHDDRKMHSTVLYSTDALGPVEIYPAVEYKHLNTMDAGLKSKLPVLPSLVALGVNTIWMRPVTDKAGYNPRDYYRIREEVGTPDDFKAYVNRAHELGIGVWHDAVAHGGSREFQRFKDHPEWLTYRRDGTTFDYWCADFNWPSWVEYMADYVEWYTREYRLDGWRMDVPYGSRSPNWNRDIPYVRASYSKLQGGFNQQRGMRAGARRANPNAVTLAESLFNVHGTTCDAVYDIRLCHNIFRDVAMMDAGELAPALTERMRLQEIAGFPDLVRMRYIENHDSLRTLGLLGLPTKELFFALTALLPGFPMIYEEGEDGSFEAMRRVLALRASRPELQYGQTDWQIAGLPRGVMGFRRRLEDRVTTCLFNFGDDAVEFEGIRLPPLGWAVSGKVPEVPAPYVFSPAKGAMTVEKAEKDGRRIYRFRNGERWLARTAEGLFEAPWIVRHPTFEETHGFVYRNVIEGAVRFDSRYHPFGFDEASAAVGAVCGTRAMMLVGFAAGAIVKVLDRVGDERVLAVSVEGPSGERMVEMEAPRESVAVTGDGRLRQTLGGWVYEDKELRVRMRRNGVISGLWRNGRKELSCVRLAADKSSGASKEVRQDWDPEPQIEFCRNADGVLKLVFRGVIRNSSRQASGRLAAPVAYVTTCAFDGRGGFDYHVEFVPDEKRIVKKKVGFFVEKIDAAGKVIRQKFTAAGEYRL